MPELKSERMVAEDMTWRYQTEDSRHAWEISWADNHADDILATILWSPAFQQYCCAVWEYEALPEDCHRAIADFLRDANAERRKGEE